MRCLLALALLGCASSGGGPSPSSGRPDRVILVDDVGRVYRSSTSDAAAVEQLVPGTTPQVVHDLVGAYEAVGVPVTTLEPKTGRVAAENFVAPSRLGKQQISAYVDCGVDHLGRPRASVYDVMLTMISLVRPASEGEVRVSTSMTATARPRGVSGNSIDCMSTRALEQRLTIVLAERRAR